MRINKERPPTTFFTFIVNKTKGDKVMVFKLFFIWEEEGVEFN